MAAVVVVGAQWGDEGKGKIVDYLAELADVVVRYAGGPNAGHTLVVDGEKLVVRLVPSGILRPSARCVLAQGMVVDPALLVKELDELESRGHKSAGRLFLSDRAHAILRYHVLADGLREDSAEPGRAIGTTKKGIGPAYEDKAARRGIHLGYLRDRSVTESAISAALAAWAPIFRDKGCSLPSLAEVMNELQPLSERLVPLLADTSKLVADSLRAGDSILLEGAQGTLLDIDHGTYPFVTSSSAIAGGACTGVGIGPRAISHVLGITKAYATRVGGGPFPTELHDATGDRLRGAGAEFGSVTGRPRRTGWLDIPALKYAARVNGFDGLVLTKLDVLTGIDPLRVCVGYRSAKGLSEDFPLETLGAAEPLEPVWEEVPGWTGPLSHATRLEDLPKQAQEYIRFVERHVGVPFDMISVGPGRNETIVLRNPFKTH